jgi:NAD(P)-dependent dehydrogenase (short-subunit alcohol dehydrogenase family)
LVVSDIKESSAMAVAAKVEGLGRNALTVKTDVRREDECRTLIDSALKEMGRLDILVCSAGTAGVHFMRSSEDAADVEHIPMEVWDLSIDVNLRGVFLCNRAIIPYFKQQKRGRIINISSDAGRRGVPLLPVYGASKAGVINLSQSIALQLAPYNINVNTICPGIIWTPLWEEGIKFMVKNRTELKGMSPEEAFNLMIQTSIPFKRPQTPEDIGNLVVFLASDRAREITGQAINVDGGSQLN